MAVRKRRKPRKEGELAPVTPQEAATNKRFVMTLVIIALIFVLGFVVLQYLT